jgi:hypothetical protein
MQVVGRQSRDCVAGLVEIFLGYLGLYRDIPCSEFSFMFIVVVVGRRARITRSDCAGQLGRWVLRRSPPSRRPRQLRR